MPDRGGLYPRPKLRASRMLRFRRRFRRVPQTVDLSTFAERRVIVTGYAVEPKRELVSAALLNAIRVMGGEVDA